MKLKKIASLALAGVMAVSMLAGCKGGSTVVDGNGSANVPSIVSAVNNGQSITNDVKVTFTTDAALENAAKKAVEMYADGTTTAGLTKVFEQYADLLGANTKPLYGNQAVKYEVEVNGQKTEYDVVVVSDKDDDGETVTILDVTQIANSPASDAYIMNAAAAQVDYLVSILDATTKVPEGEANATKAGDHYQDFSYTGNVCLFSVERSSGVTSYYLATVIEQTVTDHVLEK